MFPLSPTRRLKCIIRFVSIGAFLCFLGLWFKAPRPPALEKEALQDKESQEVPAEAPHQTLWNPNLQQPQPNLPLGQQIDKSQNDLRDSVSAAHKYLPSNDDLIERMRAEKLISRFERKIIPGLGEDGKPVHLTGSEGRHVDEVMKKEAFNLIVSDKMPLNRSLPDTRDSL